MLPLPDGPQSGNHTQSSTQTSAATMSVQWEDSEFEDSPRDDVSSMFSNSPNMGKPLAAVPMARALSTDSDDVEDVDGDMASFYGHPVSSAARAAPRPLGAPGGGSSNSSARFQDVPVRLVPEMAGLHPREGASAAAAKRAVIRHIQEGSMQQVAMHCQAVLVRGTSGSYFVYHVEITSDYYKQRWVVCKRYSEFHRLRKRILDKLAAHKKRRGCAACARVGRHLKALSFPKRVALFKDPSSLVTKRTSGLEDFIVSLCQYLGGGGGHDRGADDAGPEDFAVCAEITATRFLIKEFLQFPIEHECQHVRAIRQLKYVDPRDVQVDTQTCPICLCEWNELDGHQLVLSPCGHFFHAHCINEWYRTRFDCPMCRTIAGEPNGM